MIDADDAKRLRVRDASRSDAQKRPEPGPSGGAPSLVARTKVVHAYPSVASAYYACETQTVSGTEAEGGPATVTGDGTTFYALNLGTLVPPQGTPIVVTFVGNRWAFRHDG